MPGEHITQEQADEYAIGALEPRLERAIALHLAECPACRDVVRDSERLAATMALSAPSRRASRQLRKRVWTGAGIARPALLQRAWRVAPAAAAIAAIVVAAAAFTGMLSVRDEVNDLKARYREGRVGDVEVKTKLAAAINSVLAPIRERRARARTTARAAVSTPSARRRS